MPSRHNLDACALYTKLKVVRSFCLSIALQMTERMTRDKQCNRKGDHNTTRRSTDINLTSLSLGGSHSRNHETDKKNGANIIVTMRFSSFGIHCDRRDNPRKATSGPLDFTGESVAEKECRT